jgi:putrescine aminotransferase
MDLIGVKSEGATIIDSDGRVFIDCIAGYGLFNLGHNHPRIIFALKKQLDSKELFTGPFITETQVNLARKLAEIVPGDLECSFVCNSGSEAIDSAIKLARLCNGKKEIITAKNSFHGFTFGALSASGISGFKKHFEPMVPGFLHVPFNDIDSLKEAITPETSAILLEPIQHEAGIAIPSNDYLKVVRELCDENKIIFILDEIKTGMGKTGTMFACEYFDVVPDILVLGKSLGGGLLPIGALVARKEIWKKFGLSFAMSASSFAGNSMTCSAAFETIDVIRNGRLLDDCKNNSRIFLEMLKHHQERFPEIIESAEGLGLLIGIQTTKPMLAFKMVKSLVEQNVLAIAAFGKPSVVMIEPPLVISMEQIEKVLKAILFFCERMTKGE